MSTSDSSSLLRPARPADRQEQIAQELREQIVAGHLAPGSRLPTRETIGQTYGAGANTVQRALDKLRDDGFIRSSGRNGTHVSTQPPHLSRYAVVFPGVPADGEKWVRFYTALSNEAINLQRDQGRTLPLYYGVDADRNNEDFQRLQSDVLAHRVAGIVFAASPHYLAGTPIMDEPGIPRIGIMEANPAYAVSQLAPNVESFFEKAVAFLVERGCRRIAVVNPNGLEKRLASINEAYARHGLTLQPYWFQTVHLGLPHTARNLVHLMMRESQSERPDGLIIGDDNLVEYATAGLVAAGVRAPEEVQVVAHCNFPWPTPSVVPVHRLGFDAREVLRVAMTYIDALRRGDSVPTVTPILARFEDEVQQAKEQELAFHS